MIGAKSLTTGVLFVSGLTAAVASGVLRPQRLAGIQGGTAFFIGCFAVVTATFVFRFWRLGERSAHYFRWATDWQLWDGESHFLGSRQRRITVGRNTAGEAQELPPRAQFSVCVILALTLAVATFDARALTLMDRFRQGFEAVGANYCPDEEAAAQEAEKAETNDPGCALVRRAFALGYADSLGECGKKKQSKVSAVCTLRQRDEPLFHYAFRKLHEFMLVVVERYRHPKESKEPPAFSPEWKERLDLMLGTQGQVMSTAPRASHHIWTNLPKPGEDAFEPRTCVDRYRSLSHRPLPPAGPTQASLVFEHVVGQLLFETRYEQAAGYCREYQVHWGAPKGACAKLAANPEKFLAETGALPHVRSVLRRYQLEQQSKPEVRRRTPHEFLSFSCYIEGEEGGRKVLPLTFERLALSATELKAPTPPANSQLQVARYGQIASLLAPSFHYGVLLSEAGLDIGRIEGAGFAEAFAAKDYPLSRLQGLGSLDIFLEPEWISTRTDLLQVYPYHLHLKNYVHLFRRQYLLQKGRL
ncbi:MAG: hypothetical protein ACT4TC_14405 [Myxococcaceae bacterium]